MNLSLSKITGIGQCDKVINELEYNKKGHELKKMGAELRSARYLKRYNDLKQQITILLEDINALETSIHVIASGNIKNQLGTQLLQANYKLTRLKERFAKMDLCKVSIWQSQTGQYSKMLAICNENLNQLYIHRQSLLQLDFRDINNEMPVIKAFMPDFFEEIVPISLSPGSNAGFIQSGQGISASRENNSFIRISFKNQLKSGLMEMAFFQ